MTPAGLIRRCVAALGEVWWRIWFQDSRTSPLELTRMGIGFALLLHYGLATPYLFDLWVDGGWMPRALAVSDDPWSLSLLFGATSPWQLAAFHVLFLFCCAAFMVGWRAAWVKWFVLIGQISYDHRNPMLFYGVDKILASLLLIMCLAPVGRAMSLDRVRALRAVKRVNLDAALPPYSSPWTGACIRLMQIQMAVLFFYSAISKLGGDDWWNGDALWYVFTTDEHYSRFLLHVLASQYWLVNVGTYGTILIEIAYPFLIWQRATRPYLLGLALFLYSQFAILMGLFYFSFVMMTGHMSFMRPEWLTRLGLAWKRRMGDMEMIYDGRCGFCFRSMAWFLAFDGLGQIRTRDFRIDPSPAVSDEKMEKALHLVLPDGRALPGFDAYRYVVPRVPGLWWMVPFFYVPVLSRLIGRPVYHWIATHRSTMSAIFAPAG